MGSAEKFSLRWNDFAANVSGSFRELRREEDFFDVTLACEDDDGPSLRAHRLILSACSPLLRRLLREAAAAAPGHPCPLLYLRGVRRKELALIVDFVYHGEVSVAQDDLDSFLNTAEELRIKGLTQEGEASERGGSGGGGGGGFKRPGSKRQASSSAGPSPVKTPRIRKTKREERVFKQEEPSQPADDAAFADVANGDGGGAGDDGNYYDDDYGADGGGGDDLGQQEEGVDETMQDEGDGDQAAEGAEAYGTMKQQGDEINYRKTYGDVVKLVDGRGQCLICGSRFSTFLSAKYHARDVHTSSKRCYLCGGKFKHVASLNQHLYRKHQILKRDLPKPPKGVPKK